MEHNMPGERIRGQFESRIYKPGAVFAYELHIPPECRQRSDNALLVQHDGLNDAEVTAMYALAQAGMAPYAVTFGIMPASFCPADGGEAYDLRLDCYDVFTPAYAETVVYELIPALAAQYGLSLSADPDMHMVSGGSSGGISAFNMAFAGPDYFHRVYMSSPSFLSMVKGEEIPALVRKTEPKPLRLYVEYSENEPDDYFGSSFCAAQEIIRALTFAGYDFRWRYFAGEGHCSRYRTGNAETLREGLAYLWKDYTDKPLCVAGYSPRARDVIVPGKGWENATAMPTKAPEQAGCGCYACAGESIWLTDRAGDRRKVAEGLEGLSAVVVSCDQRRLYVAQKGRGCVYSYLLAHDGSLGARYLHGALHMKTDFVWPGAMDMCVDRDDRLYVLTEAGIQTVRSYGLVDFIMPLPDQGRPQRIALEGDRLYVETSGGLYRREVVSAAKSAAPTAPKFKSYYDGRA